MTNAIEATIARILDTINAADAHDNGYHVDGLESLDYIDAETLDWRDADDNVYVACWDASSKQWDVVEVFEDLAHERKLA